MTHTTRTRRKLDESTYELVEVVEAYLIDGVEVSREEWEETLPGNKPGANDSVGVGMLPATSCAAWPILSDGFGVHPEQVEEARAHATKMGTPCDFDPKTGCAIFTDPAQRRAVLKSHFMHDRNDVGGGQSRTYKPTIGREDYV
jgi:hypothetical protein